MGYVEHISLFRLEENSLSELASSLASIEYSCMECACGLMMRPCRVRSVRDSDLDTGSGTDLANYAWTIYDHSLTSTTVRPSKDNGFQQLDAYTSAGKMRTTTWIASQAGKLPAPTPRSLLVSIAPSLQTDGDMSSARDQPVSAHYKRLATRTGEAGRRCRPSQRDKSLSRRQV